VQCNYAMVHHCVYNLIFYCIYDKKVHANETMEENAQRNEIEYKDTKITPIFI